MLTRARSALDGLKVDPAPQTTGKPAEAPRPAAAPTQRPIPAKALQPRPAPRGGANGADGPITGPQQRILDSLAWWAAFGIDQPTNEQVGFVAGYSPGSGNFNNLKGQLRAAGLIEYPTPGAVSLTPAGAAISSAPALDVTTAAFHTQVRAKLSAPQLRLFDPILAAHPATMRVEEVAAAADYSAGSGNFNNLRGQLRTIGLIDYPAQGHVRAADWLFP
jgi:hypothetical protein